MPLAQPSLDAFFGAESAAAAQPSPSAATGRKRKALGEVDSNAAKRPKESVTTTELRGVSRDLARATLGRLVKGYKDKSGAAYGPAKTNAIGCILAQKGANRDDRTGYVQIAPVVETRTRAKLGGDKKEKPKPQGAHRLAVLAYKDEDEVERMLAGQHASHRCHQPRCFNHDHIVVEQKDKNEGRKACAGQIVILANVGGVEFRLNPEHECQCQPACIFGVERREAKRV